MPASTPVWPDDPLTVEEARADPEVLAGKSLGQIADHTAEVIAALERKPALIGHSTGGLLGQMIAGRGLSAVTVAIDPGPFRGVLPLPASALKVGPSGYLQPTEQGPGGDADARSVQVRLVQRALRGGGEGASRAVPRGGAGKVLMQMANANLNPRSEARVDTRNPERGPLLIIDGEKDHTVPWAIANAAYKKQRRNPGVTEIVKVPNRGHALTIDSGWREVADTDARVRQALRPTRLIPG